MNGLGDVVGERAVLVCCGAGGVGKTTTAAALGVGAAMAGRHCCVITVDPARRLADALGAEGGGDDPHLVEGPWPGRLEAVTLDAKTTFDALVGRYAADAGQAERILQNRVYRNLSSVLSGTQEYMATERLFELRESGRYELIVVDTPPTRHALDFLDAPRRVENFLGNRLFHAIVSPRTAYLRAAQAASQLLLRSIARVIGVEVVDDVIAFFQAFQGMEEGFRERAANVERLLSEDATGFVLVAAPRRDAIADASFFVAELKRRECRIDALVVNRLHPDFGPVDFGPVIDPAPHRRGGEAWAELVGNLDQLAAVSQRERASLEGLSEAAGEALVVAVPLLLDDVHDLDGLIGVVSHLI